MSQSISEILDQEIYPAIYQNIQSLFPEFGFKARANGYVSTTEQKVTGEAGKRGKVSIYANNPGHFIDYTRGPVSIWDYVQTRDQLDNRETLEKLAELAGIELSSKSGQESGAYVLERKINQIREDAQSYFQFCLEKSEGGKQAKAYLQSRGFDQEQQEKLGFGYVTSRNRLRSYLTEIRKHDPELTDREIVLNKSIGYTHKLSIPFRDHRGKIQGFAFRTLKEGIEPRYMYSTGFKRSSVLFNLRTPRSSNKLILVEGLFDALMAQSRGLENVAALGGTAITEAQIKLLNSIGVEIVILCLDSDEAGKQATYKAIEQFQRYGRFEIFVASLPESEGKVDPDSFIREHGVDVFRDTVGGAVPYYVWMTENL